MSARPHRPTRLAREDVTLRIPASTSNWGSGFDTVGLALRLHQFIRLTRLASSRTLLAHEPPEFADASTLGIARTTARWFFERTRQDRFDVQMEQWGEAPVARGLGASALLRVGVVAGLHELTRAGLTRQELTAVVSDLEGPPDNASPAVLGGFTVSGRIGGQVRCRSSPVSPKLKFVRLFPGFGIDTARARWLLPMSCSPNTIARVMQRRLPSSTTGILTADNDGFTLVCRP